MNYELNLKILIFVFGGCFGAVFASLLGNIAYRKSFKKIIKGYSHCEKCKKQLSFVQLIPVLGWVINKGKCPHCNYSVPIIYPLFEFMMFLIGGMVSVGCFKSGIDWVVIAGFFILGYLAIYDLLFYEIDDKLVNFISILGFGILVLRLFLKIDFPYVENTILIFAIWGIYFLITKLSKKTLIGMGDFRFFTMLLLIVPWQKFVAGFWAGGVIGGIVAMFVILLKRNSWRGTKIPYIPLFSLGIFLAWYMGWDVIVQEWVDVLILYKDL
ncbi:MAG TPA: prepilin peptidase [Candidatus Dojkabacteria bacterium]|nr:prepilin peptidase [Candidatus Dojkabacteria bacterium]